MIDRKKELIHEQKLTEIERENRILYEKMANIFQGKDPSPFKEKKSKYLTKNNTPIERSRSTNPKTGTG